MRALLNHEAAGRDRLTDEFAETIHRAVRLPCDVIEQFERVAVDGLPEQVGLGLQMLTASRLGEWNARSLSSPGGGTSQPCLDWTEAP